MLVIFAMAMVRITNLAALPAKIIIPVFAFSILIDLGTPFIYDDVKPFQGGNSLVDKDDLRYYNNKNGQKISRK